MDENLERADNGSVVRVSMAALLLILAGLGLMVLDGTLTVVAPAHASIQQPH